jgi:hypothetical protein
MEAAVNSKFEKNVLSSYVHNGWIFLLNNVVQIHFLPVHSEKGVSNQNHAWLSSKPMDQPTLPSGIDNHLM